MKGHYLNWRVDIEDPIAVWVSHTDRVRTSKDMYVRSINNVYISSKKIPCPEPCAAPAQVPSPQ